MTISDDARLSICHRVSFWECNWQFCLHSNEFIIIVLLLNKIYLSDNKSIDFYCPVLKKNSISGQFDLTISEGFTNR